MDYLAHAIPESQRVQSILAHLSGTAALASTFARTFDAEELGAFCGMLHDIGKYSLKFQRRIRGAKEQVDHSTAGAQTAFMKYRNVPAAFCIAGHHGGLPDGGNSKFAVPEDATFFGKMRRTVGAELEDYSAWETEVQVVPAALPPNLPANRASQFFFTRMLYSCLVDADFLDTEAFMQSEAPQRGSRHSIEELDLQLEEHIADWRNPKEAINQKRCEILRALIQAGQWEKGLFTLTVPTGGGKTVSSMAFALQHAKKHHMDRVIYVIPYTSIIEQTQQVFEKIFGAEHVVAHYASLDYETNENGEITDRRYLATENWDAPIIITTAVQFFESLHANKSSKCRKLHNIANSVILFDEAQMLPVPYLIPCVSAIAQLVQNYGCSAVLCSATQPALNRIFEREIANLKIRELCPDVAEMYLFFRRVQYENIGMISEEDLSERLNAAPQVLCIVNSRKQAQRIYVMLQKSGSYHLSTMMCPAHRRGVLSEIRDRLKEGMPVRVISTSLIEAGVDVDFPVVYRALAGLDSMVQAGGRCNREGKRILAESTVYLFETAQKPPPNIVQNLAAAKHVLREYEDISSLEAIKAYFEFLYYRLKDDTNLDEKEIMKEIETCIMPFSSVAEKFHIIEDSGYVCYLPWGEGKALLEELKAGKSSRGLMRKLGQYSVGVYQSHFQALVQSGAAERIGENGIILEDMKLYSDETGLSFDVNSGEANFV